MALTYEDMNCETAGLYDSTAWAILHGVGDWLGVELVLDVEDQLARQHTDQLRAIPNPFFTTTQIHYRLAGREQVSLRIFDALGREIEQLVNGYQEPGSHVVRVNADRLAPGIYFAQLRVGSVTRTLTLSHIQGR
jgi:hypothetical protein